MSRHYSYPSESRCIEMSEIKVHMRNRSNQIKSCSVHFGYGHHKRMNVPEILFSQVQGVISMQVMGYFLYTNSFEVIAAGLK